MIMKNILILLLSFYSIALFSQGNDTIQNNINLNDTSDFDEFDYFFTEDEVTKYLSFKPIIGIGSGVLTYKGDVQDRYTKSPLIGLMATNLNISKGISEFLSLNFNIIYGELTGNERTLERNLNFKTDIFVSSAYITYNFYHLLKKEGQLITYYQQRKLIPMLSLGIESFNLSSKTDLKNSQGYTYHYWSDGTIRNLQESASNETQSILLQRDYIYETDLREQNNDGLGKYNLSTISFPIDFGVQLNISKRITMKLGANYHFSLSNYVDDISDEGIGTRKGNSKGDNFLYSYITLNFDIFSSEKEILDTTLYGNFIFQSIDFNDEDEDGVLDWDDRCAETSTLAEVDERGCPLDDDKDGIPNYRDKEILSLNANTVGLDGVLLTDEQVLAMSTPKEAIPTSKLYDYYPSLLGKGYRNRNFFTEIPDKYKPIDEDRDGYISLDEISLALDKFFDFKLNLSIDEIYELNDFFFEQ